MTGVAMMGKGTVVGITRTWESGTEETMVTTAVLVVALMAATVMLMRDADGNDNNQDDRDDDANSKTRMAIVMTVMKMPP